MMPEQPSLPNDVREVIRFRHPLANMARCLAHGEPIKIVAIGSSSTRGAGGTTNYPDLLKAALIHRFPNRSIEVLNKGADGEEAADEVARFATDVFAENPTMVIWQVGTNAAWKGYDLDEVTHTIQDGLAQLRQSAADADVVLMDLQYTTAMIDPVTIAYSNDMVARIAGIAKDSKVNLFRRFALMRFWSVVWGVSVAEMSEPGDKHLHQSDWSYDQVAKTLDQAIWERLQRDGVTLV